MIFGFRVEFSIGWIVVYLSESVPEIYTPCQPYIKFLNGVCVSILLYRR